MSDKQWVVVPKVATVEMVAAAADAGARFGFGHHYAKAIAAAPRYEAGDALKAGCDALRKRWKRDEDAPLLSSVVVEDVQAVITAALPELVARCEALEADIERAKLLLGRKELENIELQAALERWRKGVV